VYDGNGTISNRKTLSRQAVLIPKVVGVPRYKDFNTIRKNHHVKDEEVLRYVPYFGETDDVDLSEVYKVEVRGVGEEEDLECKCSVVIELMAVCKILSRIVEKYLEISGLTVDQVVKFLKDGKGKSDTLSNKIRNVKEVWDKRTEIDLEDVLEWYYQCS